MSDHLLKHLETVLDIKPEEINFIKFFGNDIEFTFHKIDEIIIKGDKDNEKLIEFISHKHNPNQPNYKSEQSDFSLYTNHITDIYLKDSEIKIELEDKHIIIFTSQ